MSRPEVPEQDQPDEVADKLAEAQALYEQYLQVADVARTAASASTVGQVGHSVLLPYANTIRITG